jgi:hypothetical protein
MGTIRELIKERWGVPVANAVRELKAGPPPWKLLVFGSAMLVRSLMKAGLASTSSASWFIRSSPAPGRRFYRGRNGSDHGFELLEARPLSGGVLFPPDFFTRGGGAAS